MRTVLSFYRHSPAAIAGAAKSYCLHNARQPKPNLTEGVAAPSLGAGVYPLRLGEYSISRALYEWGEGFIQGTVLVENTPASRMVRLLDLNTGMLWGQTWSRADGFYRFNTLSLSLRFVVLAHDHTQQFNAVIADGIQATPSTSSGV